MPSTTGSRDNHLCWVYHDLAVFRRRAAAFLISGLVAGHRLEYLGSGDSPNLRRAVASVPGLDALTDAGKLTVRSLDDVYGGSESISANDPVVAWAAATREAVEAGYTGLRVVAEATALVATPEQRATVIRYEHLVDRFMVDQAFFALCGYHGPTVGHDAVHLACLHPQVNRGATGFQFYAGRDADVDLAGELDYANAAVFEATLAWTLPLLGRSPVTVDARGLDFIDHRGLLALERQARAQQVSVILRTGAPIVHRLVELLELQAIHPEVGR